MYTVFCVACLLLCTCGQEYTSSTERCVDFFQRVVATQSSNHECQEFEEFPNLAKDHPQFLGEFQCSIPAVQPPCNNITVHKECILKGPLQHITHSVFFANMSGCMMPEKKVVLKVYSMCADLQLLAVFGARGDHRCQHVQAMLAEDRGLSVSEELVPMWDWIHRFHPSAAFSVTLGWTVLEHLGRALAMGQESSYAHGDLQPDHVLVRPVSEPSFVVIDWERTESWSPGVETACAVFNSLVNKEDRGLELIQLRPEGRIIRNSCNVVMIVIQVLFRTARLSRWGPLLDFALGNEWNQGLDDRQCLEQPLQTRTDMYKLFSLLREQIGPLVTPLLAVLQWALDPPNKDCFTWKKMEAKASKGREDTEKQRLPIPNELQWQGRYLGSGFGKMEL